MVRNFHTGSNISSVALPENPLVTRTWAIFYSLISLVFSTGTGK